MNKLFNHKIITMKKITTLCFFLFLLVGTSTFAQKEIKEGVISMEITKVDCDNEQYAGMLQMMKGSQMSVAFDKDNSLMTMNMMGGMMKTRALTKKNSKEMVTLIDAMGQKMMNKMAKEEFEKTKGAAKDVKMDVTYDKSDTKKILDYTCHKATIKIPLPGQEGKFVEMNAYVTKDLKLSESLMQGVEASKLEGTPLEYSISASQQGMSFSMTFTATGIETSIDRAIFELDTEGYKEVTLEQMQSMGGMGF